MKVAKFCLVFVFAFVIAWILIFTFTQEPFRATAPIKIFWYQTPEFPMYVFAAFASAATLLFGFAAAAYYYIAGRAGIRSKKREIARLEEVVQGLESELESIRMLIIKPEEKGTASQKAVVGKGTAPQKAVSGKGTASQKAVGGKGTASQKAVGEKDLFA